jgi:hypothetical protein
VSLRRTLRITMRLGLISKPDRVGHATPERLNGKLQEIPAEELKRSANI